jgi:hypothetical protein
MDLRPGPHPGMIGRVAQVLPADDDLSRPVAVPPETPAEVRTPDDVPDRAQQPAPADGASGSKGTFRVKGVKEGMPIFSKNNPRYPLYPGRICNPSVGQDGLPIRPTTRPPAAAQRVKVSLNAPKGRGASVGPTAPKKIKNPRKLIWPSRAVVCY